MAYQQVLSLADRFKSGLGVAVVQGAITNVVQACSLGGRVEIAVNDANNNQILDGGDSMSIKAQGCRESIGTMDGSMEYAVQAASGTIGSSQYSATVSVKVSGLRVSAGASSMSGQGEFHMTMAATGNGAASVTMSIPSFSTSGTLAGSSFQSRLTGYTLQASSTLGPSGERTLLNFGGTLNSTALESRDVTVSTPAALVLEGSDVVPRSGQVLAKGASGSQVRVTVQNGGKLLVELDANGDNAFETSTTRSWSELLG